MNPPRQMPYGFEQDASTLCQLELMAKYHCTPAQVCRWRKELGVNTNRRYGKPVIQIDPNTGKTVAQYKTMSEAAKAVNGTYQNIAAAASGTYNQAYGYKWRFDSAN